MSIAETYGGRNVFVTGHTGFKGSWISHWLVTLGAQVTGYALDPPTQPSLFDALDLRSRIDHVVADVRDRGRLAAEVNTAQPSVILHLAAEAIVRRGYVQPVETFETNVMGTVNVLDAARTCPSVRAVVIVTSDKCYQNHEAGQAFRETDPMGGRDPYSASKGCAELVTAAYRDSFFADGAAVASARPATSSAAAMGADRLVPECRAGAGGRPAGRRPEPDAIRPWQHVLEPLAGYLQLGTKLLANDGQQYAGAWNFGPAGAVEDVRCHWVVEQFLDGWGSGTWTTPAMTALDSHTKPIG